jgi:hypothetical protein
MTDIALTAAGLVPRIRIDPFFWHKLDTKIRNDIARRQ